MAVAVAVSPEREPGNDAICAARVVPAAGVWMGRTTGIEVRHARSCASRSGARCNCSPSYQADIGSGRDRARIRKTFPTLAAAESWCAEATVALNRGEMRAPSSLSVREAGEAWVAGTRGRGDAGGHDPQSVG